MGEREGEEGEIGRGEGVVTELQASVVACGANARASALRTCPRATEAHFDTHIHTCTQATVAPMIGLPAEYTPPKPHVTVPRRI